LDGIASGAQVNVATDITYDAATREVRSSTGTDATLPLVSTSTAGLAPATGTPSGKYLKDDGTWNTVSALVVPAYKASNWIWPYTSSVVAGGATNANTIFFLPFFVWRSVTVNRLGARVTTLAASSNFQLAIYAANATNDPTGTPLGATGDLSGATATTVESADLTPFTLEAGKLYYAAINRNNTALAFSTLSGANSSIATLVGASTLAGVSNAAANIDPKAIALGQTYGTWPDVTSSTFDSLGSAFRAAAVFLRINSVL
jgi:hypothetical protein